MPLGTSLPAVLPESDGTLTQHVSPTGNDSTGDGSVGNPWKTINKAWTHASLGAGSIIYLRGNAGEHGNLAGTGRGCDGHCHGQVWLLLESDHDGNLSR